MSDGELQTRVRLFLGSSPITFRSIHVSADGGHVTLRGTVCSFYHKQLAQEFARRVAGVRQVTNELEVVPPTEVKKPAIKKQLATATA